LRRVFENLLANAIKHNPPGMHLSLNVAQQDQALYCTVQDNGAGMNPEVTTHLFDLYFRGAPKQRSTGLGLGLYLCRQIITAHGGEIGVDSTPNQGSTFWFTLPLTVPAVINASATSV
jgi:signal transduction histidine kinase